MKSNNSIPDPAATADSGWLTILLITALLWGLNLVWLVNDTRPPVWDMALHQTYALGYLDHTQIESIWQKSGNYPPFVHLVIAFLFLILHPGPHVAALANVPATVLLLWAIYQLARDLAGRTAATWACILTALIPYTIWMSRETVLDYWLAAFFAASLVFLRRVQGFQSRRWSLLLGILMGLGLLTKWFFAGLVFVPLLYVVLKNRLWTSRDRCVNFADALVIAGILAGAWYLPNIPRLIQYFQQNATIGAREGEPPVLSFQSLVYYLRLLEGYQLFALLFVLVCLACIFVLRKRLIKEWDFLAFSILGGWAVMTLLRTKDPRFTMPLLGPLIIIPGVWISSWRKTGLSSALKAVLVMLLCFQAYAANFGVSWLPERVVLLQGYQGSVRWDWNLYLQNYFGLLGKPKQEDWKQDEILRKIAADSAQRKVEPSLALVPDLPYFNEGNFNLYARMRGLPARAVHLQSGDRGQASFDGYNYVVMTEREQGMSWTTEASAVLNKIIVDSPQIFRLIELYKLPSGDGARLYFVHR